MDTNAMLLPAAALVLLTAGVWFYMYVLRIGTIRRQRLDPEQFKTRDTKNTFSQPAAQASDNLLNLFELPVLFYALTAFVVATGASDGWFVSAAWLYVALRYLHSLVHVTYNRVRHRFYVYAASCLVLWVMWLRFGYQLLA